ncbi:hypothetical protein [Candidatus Rhabdochlamydia porcellionis]|jgi:hypothetical protein|uniref:Uncharacterized protein n=1 Tax=Candidatus Rhabdochlamydia porcellionis TaxID=225148 RepID=A0ABX8Z3Y1_9BACT|nr:hypothetical protein [Candidatus Rhabdochlamydia porcellionis]QZA59237.1 hypothetical protein RHAB15C_0001122 [Candidatus Rhabdochlamydia porcellionis]
MFSIEKSLSQQIRNCLQKTNNLFTQLYLKNIWETTVNNETLFKKPLAFICYFKKRKQLLKKSKKTNKIFLFSIKMIICAAHERWPLSVNPDYIYKSLLMSGKQLSKEEFYEVLREKEENYQREAALFLKALKTHFFYLVPQRERNNPQLRKVFFDAVLYFLQDPKMQEVAIKRSTRKSKTSWLSAHKMKDIKEIFYEESEINSFEDAA